MCRTTIGRVLSVKDGMATVDLDGLQRSAVALSIPDLREGDLVLVGLGVVLGRVDPGDRAELAALTTDLVAELGLPRRT